MSNLPDDHELLLPTWLLDRGSLRGGDDAWREEDVERVVAAGVDAGEAAAARSALCSVLYFEWESA